MRADHDIRAAAFDGGEGVPLLCGGHRAGQQRAAQAELVEHGRERFGVLRRENFGRRHEGRLPAVLRRKSAQSRRNDRLARADIALHEAVHRPSGGAVGGDFPDGAALCAGRRKRERGEKFVQPAAVEADAAVRAAALLELLKAAAQQKQLLEHHAAACLVHFSPVFRTVNGGKRVRRVRQAVLDAQQLGQRVGPVPRHGVERGLGHAGHVALGQPGGQRIHRHDAAGMRVAFRDLFGLRRNHLPPAAEPLHPAVKQVFLPDAQLRRRVRLVEPCHAE